MGQRPSHTGPSDHASSPISLDDVVSGEALIPLDIALLIIDLLDFNHLKIASTLNRCINGLVNRRLWNTVKIYDRGDASARERRRYLIGACKAVTRDQQRADCIQALTISWCYPMGPSLSSIWQGDPVTYISQVLAAVRNLRELKILYENNQANPLTDALCAHRHVFRLRSFEISAMPGTGLHPFLEAQSDIEEYRVVDYRDRVQCTTNERDVPAALPCNVLPSLRRFRFSGHSECVRNTLRGRSIETVEATPAAMHGDIKGLLLFEERLRSGPKSAGRTQNDSPRSVIRNLSIHLWGLLHGLEHFPDVISELYGLSLPHIKSLRIESWDCWRGRDAIVVALRSFPNIEYFECMGPEEVEDWVPPFVLACAKSAPTLRRISITHGVVLMDGIINVFSKVPASEQNPFTDRSSESARLAQLNGGSQRGEEQLLSDAHSVWTMMTCSLYSISLAPRYWEYGEGEVLP